MRLGVEKNRSVYYLCLALGVTGTCVLYAVLAMFHLPHAIAQISSRSEVVSFRLGSRLHLSRLEISDLAMHGAASVEVRGITPVLAVAPGERFEIEMVGDEAPTREPGDDAVLELEVDAGQLVSLQQMHADGQDHYRIQTGGGARANLTLLMQAGQALLRNATPIAEGGQVVMFTAGREGLTLEITVVAPHTGRIHPVRITSLDFTDTLGPPSDELEGSSSLISAELLFLDGPDRWIEIRQGGDLTLRPMRGTLNALALETAGIVAHITGEVGGARLTVANGSRELRPTLFEYIRYSSLWCFVIGGVGIIGGVIPIWGIIRRRKERTG